jgi:hypothetical protein
MADRHGSAAGCERWPWEEVSALNRAFTNAIHRQLMATRWSSTQRVACSGLTTGIRTTSDSTRVMPAETALTRTPRGPYSAEPRIYYAQHVGEDPPYVIPRSGRGEIDRPAPGTDPPRYHYHGGGGVQLSNPLRRIAFAIRFGDLRLLLTETVHPDSRLMITAASATVSARSRRS